MCAHWKWKAFFGVGVFVIFVAVCAVVIECYEPLERLAQIVFGAENIGVDKISDKSVEFVGRSRVAEVVGVAVQNQPGGRSIGLAVVGCQQIV